MPSTLSKLAIGVAAIATGAEAFSTSPASLSGLRNSNNRAISIRPASHAVAQPRLRGDRAERAGIVGLRAGLASATKSEAPPRSAKDEKMYSLAQENFRRWNQALVTQNYEKVASLYCAEDLSFLPTVSPEFIQGSEDTQKYFIEFVKKQPMGAITEDRVQSFEPGSYLHTGMYTFQTNGGPVQARFSYMWRKVGGIGPFGGEWKIVHHHSSVVPSAPAAPLPTDLYPTAQENFAKWNDALKAKDYDAVAAMYCTKDLSFLPTVSPEFIRDPKKTQQYFIEFIKKQPEGTITSDNVQQYGSDAYLHTGMYTFMVGPDDARSPVEARFSYMWRKNVEGKWVIVHHHSSAVPKAPGAAEAEAKEEEMYPIAQENFKSWNDALLAKDYMKVADHYCTEDLSFLPTVSPNFIKEGKDTQEYFINFLQKLPDGKITADKVQPYGKDAYLHTGMYTFMVGPEDARQPVEARFSYMWRKNLEGKWKIVHHHSSAVPKAPGSAAEEAKEEQMYPIAQENFKSWNDALLAKDYEKVADHYCTEDLSFLPTVSPKFIQGDEDTKDYFVEFVKKQPSGVITADKVQPYGKDAYLHTGMYTFTVGPEDARQPVEARFSYMWRKNVEGKWKIVHHHSSQVPGAPAPAKEQIKAEEMYPIAQANFQKWNDGLLAKDYEKVAGMYCTEDLSFLPTVSPKFIQEGKDTKEYFINFLQKLPDGKITADKVQPYGKDAYLHTGMYTFMTGPAEDRQPVNARFSYMWKLNKEGEWKIVHHHSSARPAGAPDAAPTEEFTLTTSEDPEPSIDAK